MTSRTTNTATSGTKQTESSDRRRRAPKTNATLKRSKGAVNAEVRALRAEVQEATSAAVKYFFCVRESDQYDTALFDGMRQQTYSNHRGLRFVEAVYQAGMTPWEAAHAGKALKLPMETTSGQRVEFDVEVEMLPGRYKTVLFRFGDSLHLWCMGSAAMLGGKTAVGLYNRQVAGVVREYWPENLIVANITRLIRSLALYHWFMSNAVDITAGANAGDVRVRYIWNGNRCLDMLDPTDRRSLNDLAANAEADYLGILQRTVSGRLVSAARGNWTLGRMSVPWGYTYNSTRRCLELDESVRPQIAKMLAIMVSNRSTTDKVLALAALGMPMKRKRRTDGSRALMADAQNQHSAIYWATLRFLGLYTHGEFLFRHSNPGLRVDQLAGIPLVREHQKDRGEFQMLLTAPLPRRGWGAPKLLDAVDNLVITESNAIRTRLQLQLRAVHPDLLARSAAPDVLEAALPLGDFSRHDFTRRGASAHQLTTVLSGRRWSDNELEYQLFSPTTQMYEIRARDLRNTDVQAARP